MSKMTVGRHKIKKNNPVIPLCWLFFSPQIDHRELENTLSQSQLRFPDNQDVWLKDLASYLNFKLEKVKDVDNTFKGKPQGMSVF